MKWGKKGLIYCPNGEFDWAQNSAMTPCPILINENIIRIYAGFRDNDGVSRIGYIDVDADNPSMVIKVSKKPVLDLGQNGAFDDNGVILGDVIRVGTELWMYYVGFQIPQKAKFMGFTGLAISSDNGETFQRHSTTPVLDRCDNFLFIRAIHTVLYDEGKFKIWHANDKGWQQIGDKTFPAYNIWYSESEDGKYIPNNQIKCIETEGLEYRIGRPRVYKHDEKYIMFYTRDFLKKDYVAGYAESADGINWVRKDHLFNIEKSNEGWDSEMVCYPSMFGYKNKTYLFYNGNGMGFTGVGYAELIND